LDTGGNWWSTLPTDAKSGLLGGGASLLGSFLAPGGASSDATKALSTEKAAATTYGNQGRSLLDKGTQALGPVISYLEKLVSGDPALALSATAAPRQRVIDQYDTARRTAATGPRGGGTASAITGSYAKEASDLGVLQASAETDATKELGDLGKTLDSLGINAESLEQSGLSNVVQGYLSLAQQQNQSASGIGQGLGTLLGALAFL
jgi:hypothetical protein